MPAKSAAQYNLMQSAAHGGLKGPQQVPEAVAKEFIKKTPPKQRKMFARQ